MQGVKLKRHYDFAFDRHASHPIADPGYPTRGEHHERQCQLYFA